LVLIPRQWPTWGEVEVVVAHSERATLRVGDVFLKIDSDQTLTDIEIEHGFDPSSRGAEFDVLRSMM